jgi:mono/diheme cytochrome c family protein
VTRRVGSVLGLLALLAAAGCTDGGALSPAAERGRQLYLAQCTACHAPDPAQTGPVGPPVKGSSRALLEAKLLRGAYPPGYAPKRPTSVMQAQPALGPEIASLVEFLK